MAERPDAITAFLNLFPEPSYLEIGVNQGQTFNSVRAERKVAVDPKFLFDVNAFAIEHKVTFYEMTSDRFFTEVAKRQETYDVIYLDGLHTCEQTLRDLFNAIAFLKPQGVIVIDDVLPDSYDASLPDLHQVTRLRSSAANAGAHWQSSSSWMGDVFKLPFFIASFLPLFSYATVLENHGQAVLWHEARSSSALFQRSLEFIARLDYRDTILRREEFNIQPLVDILSHVGKTLLHPDSNRVAREGAPSDAR